MAISVTMPQLHAAQYAVMECAARFIVLVTGRRWGKTFFGVALCYATALRGGRVWWVAPTYPMTQVGWRLIAQLAAQLPGAQINKAERLVALPGGGSIQVRSGHEPDALRGEGLDLCVLDECAYMKPEVWTDAIRPALSDRRGRALFISTPKGGNWFADLFKYAMGRQDGEWAAFRYVSADNPHLDAGEIETAREVQSDRLFRQEYLAEILDDVPGALWTRALLDVGRVTDEDVPDLVRVVVAVDPAVTATEESDETGIVVAGIAASGQGYVLSDYSGRYSPDTWARRVAYAYHTHEADRVVAEVNNGGDLVATTLRTIDGKLAYRAVRASKGKYTRAEPVAALYEQGKVHHVGTLPDLEDQLCTWVPGEASPDRLDAMVWALTELMLGQSTAVERVPHSLWRGNGQRRKVGPRA
jgi:predicted phage terminase large subunit-like protein